MVTQPSPVNMDVWYGVLIKYHCRRSAAMIKDASEGEQKALPEHVAMFMGVHENK